MRCNGAGLARFHKWKVNPPGPLIAVVTPANGMRTRDVLLLLLLACSVGCGDRSASNSDASPHPKVEPKPEPSLNIQVPAETFYVGMPKRDVLAALKTLDALDITSGATYMNVDTGEHVMDGIVYSLPYHDTTIAFHYDNSDRLAHLIHCDGDDYGISKQHRAESEVNCERIAYNSDGSWSYTPMDHDSG